MLIEYKPIQKPSKNRVVKRRVICENLPIIFCAEMLSMGTLEEEVEKNGS